MDICHCGNTVDNHRFRHHFEKIGTIKLESERYIIDVLSFPLKNGERCAKKDCNGDKNRHGTILLEHLYIPESYSYREVKFTVPLQSMCKKCKIPLGKHVNCNHHFMVNLELLNLNDDDTIELTHPDDDDIKIVWK